MRLAIFELKLTLANVIRNFKILPSNDGKHSDKLEVVATRLLMPKDGIWVRLQKRHQQQQSLTPTAG